MNTEVPSATYRLAHAQDPKIAELVSQAKLCRNSADAIGINQYAGWPDSISHLAFLGKQVTQISHRNFPPQLVWQGTGIFCKSNCRVVSGQKWFSLNMSGTLLQGSGGCPPGNVFNLKINLVQSGAQKTFYTIFGCTYMSFLLNECDFPSSRTSLFPEISEIPEKWHHWSTEGWGETLTGSGTSSAQERDVVQRNVALPAGTNHALEDDLQTNQQTLSRCNIPQFASCFALHSKHLAQCHCCFLER